MEYAQYIPLLIAVVEALKEFGIGGTWSVLAGILLGVGFSLGMDFVPDAMLHVIRALMLGLAVPGFYRLAKRGGSAVVRAIEGA